MTFAQLIKILDLLDHDKEIIVKKECPNDELDWVDKFSKYDEIQDYARYFMSSDNYHFFVNDGDDFTGDEIEE